MSVRFKNARICTMEKGTEVICGELWTQGNRVSYVGPPPTTLPDVVFDREIDLQGNLILPGFKNAHTHSGMTFLRSYADDLPLLDWLNTQVFPMEAKLTGEMVYHFSKVAILEYLTSGVTANFDMYMFADEVAQASIDCGFRTVLCGAFNDFMGSLSQQEDNYVRLNRKDPLISYQLGFHGEYTCSQSLLQELSALAHSLHAPLYTHSSESKSEVLQCIERTGDTPTVRLDKLGIFDQGGGCYHCVHMTQEDLRILKERNVGVVSNPGSNVKLASGIAPVCEMLEMGIPVALGTDGPASNNCLDMFREMFLVSALQKISLEDASALEANRVLEMACKTGAQIMRLPECYSLEVGKLADLTVIDLQQPNMQPINNVTKNIVYSGSKENVCLTMVNGKILYENGEFFVGEDPEKIYAKANELVKELKSKG